jgi:hypothetical protein
MPAGREKTKKVKKDLTYDLNNLYHTMRLKVFNKEIPRGWGRNQTKGRLYERKNI